MLKILQDRPVVRAEMLFVQRGIAKFDVHKELIRDRQQRLDRLRWGEQTGLNGGMYACVLAECEHLRGKLPLHQHLAAGERHAAAFAEEHAVAQQKLRRLLGADAAPLHRHCGGGAGIHAAPAQRAACSVHMDALAERQRSLRAGVHTASAPHARLRAVPECGLGVDTLRVLTPRAAQRAALEKQRAAKPRTVVHGKALAVKNDPVHMAS